MEIHRYLRRDREKEGCFPIRLVLHFNGQRLALPTGEKVSEKGWDERKERAKGGKGGEPYFLRINGKLDKLEAVLNYVFNALADLPAPVTRESLRKAFSAVLTFINYSGEDPHEKLLKAAWENYLSPPSPTLDTPKKSFLEWMEAWIGEETNNVNLSSGKKISILTIRGHRTTIKAMGAFQEYTGKPLTFQGMDKAFYNLFKAYVLDVLQLKINTFGKHVKRLKQFLSWAEDQDENLEVNRQYRKFLGPSQYVGVDALTEDELQAIYKLDFSSEEVKSNLQKCYSDMLLQRREKRNGNLTFEAKEESFENYLRQAEYARDILLMCCYTGLRISDAQVLTPDLIQGDLIKIVAKKGGRGRSCFIPYFNDAIFKPVEIVAKYQGKFSTCLPPCPRVNLHLKDIQKLIGLTRFKLFTKIGRKTFVTLKIYQGVPSRLIMQATGHTTESAFNRYAGTNTEALVQEFKDKAGIKGAKVGADQVK